MKLTELAIELSALKAELMGMEAENQLCSAMNVEPIYKGYDFRQIGEHIRALAKEVE